MPIVNRQSVLSSPNMRASDVAQAMTEHVIPIQQQKTHAAFRVQGIESILYCQLTSGRPCSCKSSEKQASALAPDGKAPVGMINRLLTGSYEFEVTPYTSRPDKEEDGFYVEGGAHDDFLRTGPELTEANLLGPNTSGANGEHNPESIDDLMGLLTPLILDTPTSPAPSASVRPLWVVMPL